jgi:hypothetical protein
MNPTVPDRVIESFVMDLDDSDVWYESDSKASSRLLEGLRSSASNLAREVVPERVPKR